MAREQATRRPAEEHLRATTEHTRITRTAGRPSKQKVPATATFALIIPIPGRRSNGTQEPDAEPGGLARALDVTSHEADQPIAGGTTGVENRRRLVTFAHKH